MQSSWSHSYLRSRSWICIFARYCNISAIGKVIFVTNGGAPIDPIKVKRGDKLENLPVPVRGYSIFCGWYKDERFTDPWYAGVDKVTKRKTKLYAKWL